MATYTQKCWNSSSQYSVHEQGNPSRCLGLIYAPRGRLWMTAISYVHPDDPRNGGNFPVAMVLDMETGMQAINDTAEAA